MLQQAIQLTVPETNGKYQQSYFKRTKWKLRRKNTITKIKIPWMGATVGWK